MLLAVQTCFNIYLASDSKINQATARAILTQIISHVFTGMERLEADYLEMETDWDESVIFFL